MLLNLNLYGYICSSLNMGNQIITVLLFMQFFVLHLQT